MFVIKIAFKGKNILLGKGIDSFQKITSEIETRFPGEVPYGIDVKYQGSTLTHFDEVKKIVETTAVKSIKLEIQPLDQPLSIPETQVEIQKKEQNKSQNSFISGASQGKVEEIDQEKSFSSSLKKKSIEEKESFDLDVSSESATSHKAGPIGVKKVSQTSSVAKKSNAQRLQKSQCSSKKSFKKSGQKKSKKNSPGLSNGSCNSRQKSNISVSQGSLKKSFCCKRSEKNKSEKSLQGKRSFLAEKRSINRSLSRSISIKKTKSVSQSRNSSVRQQQRSNNVLEDQSRRSSTIIQSQIKGGIYESDVNEDDLMNCFYCQGSGLCKVCKSTGRLTENSKFMKLINSIVEKKIQNKLRAIEEGIQKTLLLRERVRMNEKCEESHKKQNRIEFESEVEGISEIKKPYTEKINSSLISEKKKKAELQQDIKKVKFMMNDHYLNPKILQVGDEFTWVFLVGSDSDLESKYEINIIDEKTGETMLIDFRKGKEVKVGPFKCEKEGNMEKIFRLFYFDENSDMQYFGPKFGFALKIEKDQKTRQLTNTFRMKVDGIKKGYKVERDTEYLVERLRQMGINEENYLEMQDLLPDIIQTL